MKFQDPVGVGLGLDVAKEVMEFDCNVFCPGSKLGRLGKFQGAGVVLKALGVDLSWGQVKVNVECLQIFKQVQDEKDVAQCGAQCDVLSFDGA